MSISFSSDFRSSGYAISESSVMIPALGGGDDSQRVPEKFR